VRIRHAAFALLALALMNTGAARLPDPLDVAPGNYKLVFENERVRVLSFHAEPGQKWGLHSHPDAVVVSLDNYTVRNVVPGAEPTLREAHRGDAAWIPARSHTGENAGDSSMDCILVELK
jgi:quercetin dioxygenase-like cupin family protein